MGIRGVSEGCKGLSRAFQGDFAGVCESSMWFQGAVVGVTGNFKGVSRGYHGNFGDVSERTQGVSRGFEGNSGDFMEFYGALRKFLMVLSGFRAHSRKDCSSKPSQGEIDEPLCGSLLYGQSREFQGDYAGVCEKFMWFQAAVKGATERLHMAFKELQVASRGLQGNSERFPEVPRSSN